MQFREVRARKMQFLTTFLLVQKLGFGFLAVNFLRGRILRDFLTGRTLI